MTEEFLWDPIADRVKQTEKNVSQQCLFDWRDIDNKVPEQQQYIPKLDK